MRIPKSLLLPVALTAALVSCPLGAVVIQYTAANLGGNTFENTYSVTNDDLTLVEEFTIFFELGLFENLVITANPGSWDGLAIDPDPGIPADGFADWLDFDSGIASGGTVGGFKVQYDCTGCDVTAGQFFEVVDPSTFASLASGFTVDVTSQPVPEPGTLGLLGAGLLGLAFARCKGAA